LYGEGGGGEGAETNFEKDNRAFSNSVCKTQIIHAMTQASPGILSTIVVSYPGEIRNTPSHFMLLKLG